LTLSQGARADREGAPPRVLFLIDTLQIGGTERSLLQIASRLHDVDRVVCHIYEGSALLPAFERAGVEVLSLGVKSRYGLITAVRRVAALLRTGDFDLLCPMLARSTLVGRCAGRLTGVPVVGHFVQDSYGAARYASLSPLRACKLRAWQLVDRLTVSWAVHHVANSAAIRDSNSRALGIPAKNISVIYRGRDPADFAERSGEALERVDPSARRLVCVGRLVPAKAHADILDALPEILSRFPGTRLEIAGEGPSRGYLEERVRDLRLDGCVDLLGTVDDVAGLLAKADLFVFPSLHEGHPGALIEAMMVGLPIVASDIPPHRETLLAGETGLLVPPGAPAALAAAVIRLLNDPAAAAALGATAREAARGRFSVEEIARQYEDLCLGVTAGRGAGPPAQRASREIDC
jgi:glycosyltransferase involved in cell wall biosynthesis